MVIAPKYGLSSYARTDGTFAWFHNYSLACKVAQSYWMENRESELYLFDLETGQIEVTFHAAA